MREALNVGIMFFCMLAGLTLLDAGQMFGLVLLVISVINLFWMVLNT